MKKLSLLSLFFLIGVYGCETINPLCTENYCVEGEIYPKAFLQEGANFDDLSINDAAIVATLTGIPITPVATFVRANPTTPGSRGRGEIENWSHIEVLFDNPPTYVKVENKTDLENVWWRGGGDSRELIIMPIGGGRWRPGSLELKITWANGEHTLKYTVLELYTDTDPPTITSSAIIDDETNVDPEDINHNGIEIRFDEEVTGNIVLQTKDGEDVGWISGINGHAATLEPIAGREIGYSTTYVIVGEVRDYAGNEITINITFTTLPDTEPPIIVDSTIQDGDTFVDPAILNNREFIEIQFNEEVEGNIELQTKDGENLGWISEIVWGYRVLLKRSSGVTRGRDVEYDTTYIIVGEVHDKSKNETTINITFTTIIDE